MFDDVLSILFFYRSSSLGKAAFSHPSLKNRRSARVGSRIQRPQALWTADGSHTAQGTGCMMTSNVATTHYKQVTLKGPRTPVSR